MKKFTSFIKNNFLLILIGIALICFVISNVYLKTIIVKMNDRLSSLEIMTVTITQTYDENFELQSGFNVRVIDTFKILSKKIVDLEENLIEK